MNITSGRPGRREMAGLRKTRLASKDRGSMMRRSGDLTRIIDELSAPQITTAFAVRIQNSGQQLCVAILRDHAHAVPPKKYSDRAAAPSAGLFSPLDLPPYNKPLRCANATAWARLRRLFLLSRPLTMFLTVRSE